MGDPAPNVHMAQDSSNKRYTGLGRQCQCIPAINIKLHSRQKKSYFVLTLEHRHFRNALWYQYFVKTVKTQAASRGPVPPFQVVDVINVLCKRGAITVGTYSIIHFFALLYADTVTDSGSLESSLQSKHNICIALYLMYVRVCNFWDCYLKSLFPGSRLCMQCRGHSTLRKVTLNISSQLTIWVWFTCLQYKIFDWANIKAWMLLVGIALHLVRVSEVPQWQSKEYPDGKEELRCLYSHA
jgi:hypothetical protein